MLRKLSALLFMATFTLGAQGAAAQNSFPEELEEDRGWPAGSIAEQLDRDATLVPYGKGAIFVPAMTNPLDEPPVLVWQGRKKVGEGTTGRRIPLLPGTYSVAMGSGTMDQRFTMEAEVRELNTTVLPVTWAGLAVHVFDERFNSMRSSYEVIRVEDREYIGVGFGADEEAGEPVSTWILEPGLYKIVRAGETYRARSDFATVRLVPGHLTHFLLVVDETSGEFQGAGEVPQEELFLAHRDKLAASLIIGGDFSLNSRRNVLGSADGQSFAFRAFADTKLSAEFFKSPLIIRLQIEEGQTKAPDTHWQTTQDRADLDGLYVYKLVPWLGPYLRFGAETNLVDSREYFDTATNVEIKHLDGTLGKREGQESILLMPPLGLTTIKEGAGLNLRVFKLVFGEATMRAGIGARHRVTNKLLERSDDPPTELPGAIVYERVATAHQPGIEGTVVAAARLTRWALINAEFDVLVPFEDPKEVIIEADGGIGLKLTSYLSVNYVVRYLRDRSLSEEDRWAQDVLVRFSIEIL